MKNWNFFNWLLLIIVIFILIYFLSPSVRQWICALSHKLKKKGSKCVNCNTNISGVIVASGECIPEDQVIYDTCIETNATMKDGSDCVGCGQNPGGRTADALSGSGVIVDGKCMALPDAFAGKICVPEGAPVNPSALSYKRILVSGIEYKYYKNNGNTVSQGGSSLADTEITRADYVAAFVQTIKACPTGQIKV